MKDSPTLLTRWIRAPITAELRRPDQPCEGARSPAINPAINTKLISTPTPFKGAREPFEKTPNLQQNAILYYTILYYIILYYTILYYTIL